jgi:hypothetical protein
MVKYGQLKNRIRRLLDDDLAEPGYGEELVREGLSSAFDAILPWLPKTASTDFTGDAVATAFALPADFYDVEAVVADDGIVLQRATLHVGAYFGASISAPNNDWLLQPNGYITFAKALTESQVYKLYYLASWKKFDETATDEDVMEPPDIALTGIALYAAAYILVPSATSITSVRQFGTKVDSGNPEHNPVQKAVSYLLSMFTQEMNRHPRHAKAPQ